jgi:hypothetical protein
VPDAVEDRRGCGAELLDAGAPLAVLGQNGVEASDVGGVTGAEQARGAHGEEAGAVEAVERVHRAVVHVAGHGNANGSPRVRAGSGQVNHRASTR